MGALPEVEIHVGFAGGVELKADPKVVPPIRLLALENGVFAKRGSIRKRNGYEATGQTIDGTATVVDDAIRLGARSDELIEFTPNRCYSRQDDADQLSDVGAVFSAVPSDRQLVKTGTQQTMGDHATLDGVTVAAWEDSSGGVWWSTEDANTGRIHRVPTQADSAGISPRCVPCGNNLHVYYAVASARQLFALVINPAAPSSAVTPVMLTDDLDSASPTYDAYPTNRSGSPALMAWSEFGTTNIRFGYVDQSGVLGSPALGHPSVRTEAAVRLATTPIAVSFLGVDGGTGDVIALAWVNTAPLGRVLTFTGGDASNAISSTASGDAYSATSVQRIALAIGSGSTLTVAFEEDAVAASNRFTAVRSAPLATPTLTFGAIVAIRSVGLASRAWAINDDIFAVLVHDTTYFNTYVALCISDADVDGVIPVGRHAPASAAGAPPRKHLPSAHVSDSVVSIALPVRDRLISENNDQFRETGIRLFTLDFDHPSSHQTAQLGTGLYLAGGCPMHYDGRVWTEQGFHFGPELIATVAAGGGSMTSSTTYKYVAWYEWTDAQGEVHQGPTSIGTLVTMGGGDTQVTLTLPTLRVTLKTNVRIMVARSEAAKTGETAKFYRVTSLDPTTAGDPNGYLANDTTANTVTLVDRLSDADLVLFDELYTDGGVLSADPVALGSALTVFKGRLLATDPSDGNTLRFSQFRNDGFGVQFAPELALSVDPFGGDITALAARDDRAFVFKAGAIFTFAGDGPDDTGSSAVSGFSQPQLLPGDVGCTNPASIVLTPQGFLFQSSKGIYQLGNDGSLSYAGAPVESLNGQSIRRATVLPDRTQVVFLTDSGLSLLYDYENQQWSTFTNHEGRDAVVVSNQYHYVRTDGRVFREAIGEYSDAGARITLKLETAWLHMLPQLQGFQKFFDLNLLGTWISAHQLGIQYQTDFSPGWSDVVWYDATGLTDSTGWITGDGANVIGDEPIAGSEYGDGEYGDGEYGGTAPGLYEWRLDLYEEGHSIQFRFQDFEANGYAGASFELTELALTGGILGNVRRPATAGRSA
jgi:hypothetical protein